MPSRCPTAGPSRSSVGHPPSTLRPESSAPCTGCAALCDQNRPCPSAPEIWRLDASPRIRNGKTAVKSSQRADAAAEMVLASPWWVADSAVWFVAVWIATCARFDFDVEHVNVNATLIVAATAVLANGAVASAMGIYRHRYIVASFEECAALATAAAVSVALLQVSVELVEPYAVPRSVPVLAGMFALGGALGVRWMARDFLRRHRNNVAQR